VSVFFSFLVWQDTRGICHEFLRGRRTALSHHEFFTPGADDFIVKCPRGASHAQEMIYPLETRPSILVFCSILTFTNPQISRQTRSGLLICRTQ